MRRTYFPVLLVLSLFTAGIEYSSAQKLTTTETNSISKIIPFGRFSIIKDQGVELISSAVHFGFSFEGTSCTIDAFINGSKAHNYLQYELDGQYQKKIKVEGGSQEPIVITAANNGKHTVWVYKATEAHTGGIIIRKITGTKVKAIERPAAPLVEFIGNSITCGAAADPSEVPCGSGEYHDQHNAYFAYGPTLSRALKTNFILSSVSGIGVYRNWNSDRPTMPQVYEKTDFQDYSEQKWNFSRYAPQIVSIALGTNDMSKGDGARKRLPFDSSEFVGNYISFVQLVKSKYPRARIVLLSSPMMNGQARIQLQNCLRAVKESIDELYRSAKPVALYFFNPMQAHGCSGHPNIDDHAILAKELEPFFRNLLQKNREIDQVKNR